MFFVAAIIWLVGWMRLSGLDILSAFILSFIVSALQFGVMPLLARMLEIPLFES